MRRIWTNDEISKLRFYYPNTNISREGLMVIFNRTITSIHLKASELGITRNFKEVVKLPEVRAKISAKAKLRNGMKNSFYGKKHKPETIAHMKEKLRTMFLGEKNPFYGRQHSEETRRHLSDIRRERRCGENNPAWRGGYEPYYGPNWEEQRRKALERDKHICQKCGAKEDGREHDVHHLIPFRTFGIERFEEANQLDNLITLCMSCHRKVDWEVTETD